LTSELNEGGFADFVVKLARAEAERDASWVRVGLEQAGHYHRPLQAAPGVVVLESFASRIATLVRHSVWRRVMTVIEWDAVFSWPEAWLRLGR
jgi:hypothetical protein